MNRKLLNRKKMLCLSCMEEHEVEMVSYIDKNIFKGVSVEFPAEYYYCGRTEEYYADEIQMCANDISMKDAYRQKQRLLTSKDISAIRETYGISQSDLSLLLGWGKKTITRYEGHQVQDAAHDTILKKLRDDPEWFLALLDLVKESFTESSYAKYRTKAIYIFEQERDQYLRKAIFAQYARFSDNFEYSGNVRLSLDKVVDVIRYFSNAPQVIKLYKVKLMKLLWYSDTLSFKRRGHAITGLIYQALPMGAVPIAHDSIIDLYGVDYDEVELGDGTGYYFKKSVNEQYQSLSKEDMDILDEIIRVFGSCTKDTIIHAMHMETAYVKTASRAVISFQYAKELSIP